MTLQFAWPWLFLCLPLPYLVWRLARPAQQQGAAAIRVPFFAVLSGDAGAAPGPRRRRAAIAVACWVLLVAAAARPQWLGELDRIEVSGRSLMLGVDISGSMDIGDLELDGRPVDRLAVVKTLGADFLERRTGDRVGLILFGTRAYLQAPLTFDRATVATLLDESVTGLAGERTAIGDAIGLAIKRLREVEAEQRVLVLLTDGANTAGSVEPLEAARLAATAGLTIHTIGVGAERMVVDGLFGRREINPSAELDEALLRDVSSLTGGRYFRAASTAGLDDIYRLLDRIEPVPQGGRDARRVHEAFHWPLAPVVLLAVAWMAAAWRGARAGAPA